MCVLLDFNTADLVLPNYLVLSQNICIRIIGIDIVVVPVAKNSTPSNHLDTWLITVQ